MQERWTADRLAARCAKSLSGSSVGTLSVTGKERSSSGINESSPVSNFRRTGLQSGLPVSNFRRTGLQSGLPVSSFRSLVSVRPCRQGHWIGRESRRPGKQLSLLPYSSPPPAGNSAWTRLPASFRGSFPAPNDRARVSTTPRIVLGQIRCRPQSGRFDFGWLRMDRAFSTRLRFSREAETGRRAYNGLSSVDTRWAPSQFWRDLLEQPTLSMPCPGKRIRFPPS